MSEPIRGDEKLTRGCLPPRLGAIALAANVVLALVLAGMTARECHANFAYHYTGKTVSLVPSILFGVATWLWWAAISASMWLYANWRPQLLHFTEKLGLLHLGISTLLAAPHLLLLQYTVRFDSVHWPAWGAMYSNMDLYTPRRYGLELIIYGLIYGFSCLFWSQFQTQQVILQKAEVEHRLTQVQLKALQMQMEPHFLFNTLNAITSLVAQKRNNEAMQTLRHLNTILRTTLQRKAPAKVPFTEELKIIESYLAIQQVRFAGRLEVKINATPEALDGLVPCFLLQPIVENAVNHGIAPKAAGGLVETSVKRVGDKLWMQVRDDGCGPGGSPTKGHGIGIQNIKERLAYFYPDSYEFSAVAPVDGGYEVTIQIPYEPVIV